MAKKNRKIPEVNAGSMADISFLLLIFFLVATTMNVDTGLQRMLPPMPPEEQQNDEIDIKQRNLLLVFVNRFDQINVAGETIGINQLREKAREFIANPYDVEELPEKEMTNIELIGDYPVSKGVISLQNDRGTSYSTYIQVQNELTRAFGDVRDDLASLEFGRKFMELSEEQREAIAKAIPLKISEAEPRNIEGGK